MRPGANRTEVGGSYDEALVVRVNERAVDGKATDAALKALAKALGVPRNSVVLISGATSRTKIVEVPAASAATISELKNR